LKEITRINHVGLRVRDLDISREFYDKLGFKFIAGPIGPEPVAIVEHPSGVNINFILNTTENASPVNLLMDEEDKHTGFTHIALEITDLEAVKTQLETYGIGITETVEFDGAIFFFVRDPDNNVIEFHKPAE
jgi:lactoylglutathione lyase